MGRNKGLSNPTALDNRAHYNFESTYGKSVAAARVTDALVEMPSSIKSVKLFCERIVAR